MKIYLASPLFTEEERLNVEILAKKLRENPLDTVFVPQENITPLEENKFLWAKDIFKLDKENIDSADKVVAIYYGSYSDTGTAWEIGYANAKNKPVDILLVDENKLVNIMLICPPTNNIFSFDEYVNRKSIINSIQFI